LREDFEAAIRSEVMSLNARQRLDLAMEFLQVFAGLTSFGLGLGRFNSAADPLRIIQA
jgi:hypothetical protein